jgi:hypothetical protein
MKTTPDQNSDVTSLLARIGELKGIIAGSAPKTQPRAPARPAKRSVPPGLERLEAALGLTPFEGDVLVLCAGAEIDPEVGPIVGKANGDPSLTAPTFGLMLSALPGAHWSATAPDGPLRRWRLIDVGNGAGVMQAPLRIDERILHFLLGQASFDQRLAAILTPVNPEPLAPSHRALAAEIAALWLAAEKAGSNPPHVQLCGARADCWPIAAAAAQILGVGAVGLSAERLPTGAAELENFVRLWERESALSGQGALILDVDDSSLADGDTQRMRAAQTALLDRLAGVVVIREREARRSSSRSAIAFDVGHPSRVEQLGLWREGLGALAPPDENLSGTVQQFSLSSSDIAAISTQARLAASPPPDLWDLCRRRMRGALDGLAQRIEVRFSWNDLVLPEPHKRELKAIAAQVRGRATVYDEWGFGQASRRGQGVSALFYGPSGVGKTMAAEVLASDLRLDLYHIDLSRVVSKYIGETEANLRRVFDAAEDNGAILLFDEADSLFGARSEVKDSHDRYANIEVSYLLQRMEAYRGLAILTTNMRSAIDPAFLRRLRFSIAFPFPDAPQRAEIWRRVFPRKETTAGLEPERLALLRLAGGNIHNIALNAAFLAADERKPVQLRHIREAAEAEYAKLQRRLTQAESAAWS